MGTLVPSFMWGTSPWCQVIYAMTNDYSDDSLELTAWSPPGPNARLWLFQVMPEDTLVFAVFDMRHIRGIALCSINWHLTYSLTKVTASLRTKSCQGLNFTWKYSAQIWSHKRLMPSLITTAYCVPCVAGSKTMYSAAGAGTKSGPYVRVSQGAHKLAIIVDNCTNTAWNLHKLHKRNMTPVYKN